MSWGPVGQGILAVALAILPAAAGAEPEGASHHPHADAGLMAFHALMEPIWHATPGPSLNAQSCSIGAEIEARARAAARRPTPEHAALIVSAKSLRSACDAKDDVAIATELDRLHRIFHVLAARR